MIPARRSALFAAWFSRHCDQRLRRSFHEVRVLGLQTLREAARRGPVLVVSNHTAWWDPLMAVYLTQRVLKLQAYAMMDASNLQRLPFFAKVGAFGVDRSNPHDGARALRYAAKLLHSPGQLVWIFAQGDERPIAEPLEFRPGSAELARIARRATVLPLALRYEHGGAEKPYALVAIGEPLGTSSDTETTRLDQQRAVAAQMERLEAVARSKDYDHMVSLQTARVSWLGLLAERILAWVTRP